MCKKAKLNISKYQACQKKNAQNNKKHRNFNTVNWEDIPKKWREVILGQQCALMAVSPSDATSVTSSLTEQPPASFAVVTSLSVRLSWSFPHSPPSTDSDCYPQPNAAPHAADGQPQGREELPFSALHAQLRRIAEHRQLP